MKFENAPLIELVAELRWGAPAVVPLSAIASPPFATAHANLNTELDTFVDQFGRNIAGAGYVLTERLLPLGVSYIPFQPSHRFRRADASEGTSLFSLGVGIFSANITPPYKTWESFRPIVKLGVEALLKSRSEDATKLPFVTVSLRYLNAFHSNLTRGQSAMEFMETLGIRFSLPESLQARVDKSRAIKPMLLLSVPISGNRVMNMNVGDAVLNGQSAVLMDNVVASKEPVDPTVDAVMAEFDAAREVIHDVFVQSTKPIVDLLAPTKDTE
ncbi:TIGR04255 family protein [Paraburkholderia megapolitana]|uniref:TIGR04255 family protein n=1 Tax=Paraburkholderia megapolitana TaxID=420953 RepID=A0A1I3S9V4_9BURK|nr:TIGR04255 family protein [Paraburkholderia megapolitana]QDQ85801.1 TIGR04255 family protein [Paraburkholderia megapolitana]SFJ55485.1 TIGR04255 family protein [Paraburkholderia megapolitana]